MLKSNFTKLPLQIERVKATEEDVAQKIKMSEIFTEKYGL